jgi:hypothetical protein
MKKITVVERVVSTNGVGKSISDVLSPAIYDCLDIAHARFGTKDFRVEALTTTTIEDLHIVVVNLVAGREIE